MTLGVLPEALIEARACRRLWRAVMLQAFEDGVLDQRERGWFDPGNRGFRLCCEALDVHPRRVAAAARTQFANLDAAHAERGSKPRRCDPDFALAGLRWLEAREAA